VDSRVVTGVKLPRCGICWQRKFCRGHASIIVFGKPPAGVQYSISLFHGGAAGESALMIGRRLDVGWRGSMVRVPCSTCQFGTVM
jgi:hypothetical protein